uniref:bcl-2/adenovirus E1B 19 kDa-interacting protein 2-like protein isoform X2 n=1 Tax=Doryrhamphus excisus TaxID=161450 RepID=UPI0025AE6496|nr:bcl-2/adenovirus E1B 19 kDa-interacting protein 2-like protein isoform X2 [Doryrhamphus excisus]
MSAVTATSSTAAGDSVALQPASCSPDTSCMTECEEDSSSRGGCVATSTRDIDSAEEEEREEDKEEEDTGGGGGGVEEENPSKAAAERPSTLPLATPCGMKKKKVLAAPPLSVSLGRSESGDFHSAFLSPSTGDQDDAGLDFDLDAMETPSDSESLRFPVDYLDVEEGGGVALSSRTGSLLDSEQGGLGVLEREDVVDSQGTRWRSFSTGEPPQESHVNMSVLEPFLRVLSHGGYYGDGMNDIIVFSSCYLPENSLENYQYVMDNLFRYLVGTLELMVSENYVIVYLCAGGQKDKLPGIGWLKECYHTIAWRGHQSNRGSHLP